MINLNDCIEVGVLIKTYGIKGQLILRLNYISFDKIQSMESVFVMINALPVPFFIEDISERDDSSVILKLEEITSEEKARQLVGSAIFVENKFLSNKKSKNSFQDYHGFTVIDSNKGVIGQLEEVINFEKNPVLQILQGNKEILIPFQPEFINDLNVKKKEIHVTCPPGLLELYI